MKFKKFLCYLLCGVLTFGVISTANYKSAHAMEWVSGALSFAEALTWVLASLGITCTVSDYATQTDKSRQEFWQSYEQDFYDYVDSHQGNTASDRFIEWKNKLCKGVLDKSSEYWSLFKAWASSLVSGNNSSDVVTNNSSSVVNYINNRFGLSIPLYTNDVTVYAFEFVKNFNNNNYYELNLITTNANFELKSNGKTDVFNGLTYYNGSWRVRSFSFDAAYFNSYDFYLSSNFINNSSYTNFNYISFSSDGTVVDDNFDSVTSNVDDLDVISSDGVDEDSPEVTLPYPGVSDSDDTISSDAYQDIIDAINDGTITQEDGVIEIQKILKIITYDTVTDDVVPPIKDDDGNNKKKDDVLKENKDNMNFTLGGLEAVFPFCIPFDIYAFMTLLVAEPECPEFDFPIKSVNGQVEEIHVDLAPFEPVAVVVRYCFDFLFIIGLAMLTRSLIGGGSSD